MEEIPKIKAKKIDYRHIYVTCPHCGKVHKHGSNKDFSNRTEHRSAHCNEEKTYDIIISDETPKDSETHYQKYKHLKPSKAKVSEYVARRYLKYNEEKMLKNMIDKLDKYPVLLKRVTQHYALIAIADSDKL
jgi:hypothetical protein